MSVPRRFARALASRWWPVVLAVPLGAAAGAGYAFVAHPEYTANSYVVVVSQNPGEGATALNFAQAYGRLVAQPQVLTGAVADTGRSVAALSSVVRGTTSPDAPMIEITGTGTKPQDAVRAADAVAKSLVAFANTSSKETGVRLVPLGPAAEPERPSSPSATLDTAVGGAVGVLIGALVMLTRRRPAEQPAEQPQGAAAPADESPAADTTSRADEPVAEDTAAEESPAPPRPRAEEPAPEAAAAAEQPEQPEPVAAKRARSATTPPRSKQAARSSR